jgi:hypothetical protein
MQQLNAGKKKHWFTFFGPALSLKNAGILFALKEQKISLFWKLFPT